MPRSAFPPQVRGATRLQPQLQVHCLLSSLTPVTFISCLLLQPPLLWLSPAITPTQPHAPNLTLRSALQTREISQVPRWLGPTQACSRTRRGNKSISRRHSSPVPAPRVGHLVPGTGFAWLDASYSWYLVVPGHGCD